MSNDESKALFIIKEGASIGKFEIEDSLFEGDIKIIENRGKIKEASFKRNTFFKIPRIQPLVSAIKKPIANFSIPLLLTIVGGTIVAVITVFYLQPWQDSIQEQIQDKKPEILLKKA